LSDFETKLDFYIFRRKCYKQLPKRWSCPINFPSVCKWCSGWSQWGVALWLL